ncbi:hypothetical protein HY638_05620 [Candidatus Woesearchaeota archaeon]|nr:hypothetical protein [Candidatus Woesearchaeota archaeon]
MIGKKKPNTGIFEKKQFVCSKCRYKFSVDVMKYPKAVCPWCGAAQPET